MKKIFLLLSIYAFFISNIFAQKDIKNTFSQYISGEFDNFQQAWMQNTDTKSHRVEAKSPHQHLHTVISAAKGKNDWLIVKHFAKADTQKLLGMRAIHIEKKAKKIIATNIYKIDNQEFDENLLLQKTPFESIDWAWNGVNFQGKKEGEVWKLAKDTLYILNKSLFANDDKVPYRMMKCHFFSGWIQFPFDEIKKDSTYFLAGLKIHDQGGKVQLRLPDGKLLDWTVELTQLVHSKKTPIMKLAIYNEAAEKLEWNSHSVSYAWASPDAKRIGINLRKIVSGWTLIEK